MVGKARRRRPLHQAAPRPEPARELPGPGPGGGWSAAPGKDWDFSSSDVFSGLQIDPETLVKKLDLDSRSIISSRRGERYQSSRSAPSLYLYDLKTILSKKEKMKLRKERWLQKIESVKLAKQKQKAEAKRKATPVVGDMQPLMEALPELFDLTTGARDKKPPKRYAQKRRLLEEEMARFHEVITNPTYKANPLLAISEHLSKRLRQEEEGKPF
uniref:Family with sequence similarity 207 member A n=1 Tax=Nothoprocta perdicaria TaxID=30464 RepID=A0A8C6ZMU0_NOTPE